MHEKLDVLAERGFVVLRDYNGPPVPEQPSRMPTSAKPANSNICPNTLQIAGR